MAGVNSGVLHIEGDGVDIKLEGVQDAKALLSAVCVAAAGGIGGNIFLAVYKPDKAIPPENIKLVSKFMFDVSCALEK